MPVALELMAIDLVPVPVLLPVLAVVLVQVIARSLGVALAGQRLFEFIPFFRFL